MEIARQLFKKNLPIFALILGVIFFSLGKPIIKYLIELGESFSVSGFEVISVCNVLFIGNLCAGIIALFLFGYKKIYHEWQETNRKTRLNLLIISFLIIISTMLLFAALERTSIVNIVIFSRFDGIFYLLIMIVFLKMPMKKSDYISYSLISLGLVVLLAYLYVTTTSLNETVIGDLFVIGFALVSAIVGMCIKTAVKQVPIGLQIVVLNITSSIVFLIVGLFIFGPRHFIHIFHVSLWLALGVYALIVIVFGQLFFYYGIKRVSDIAMINTLMLKPIVTVFIAYLLLHEVPNYIQMISFVIVLVGVVVGGILKFRETPEQTCQDIRNRNHNIIGKH